MCLRNKVDYYYYYYYMYRWVSYNKTIHSAEYFVIEAVCYTNSCRLNIFYFKMFSLLCEGLYFWTRSFNFLVSTFCRPELSVWRRFVAGMFYLCNILPPKNQNLPSLYETRAIFSHEICCRKFCCRRLTCIHIYLRVHLFENN